ncbi:hypothetical protein SKAU_G00077530 [Synaphobranchus kaupii]|uniref:Uncharacterized protein n=1 Tax=Synaphobranchus kaupii TaxID=118154 RepID=A0A9Q1G8V9_SYNKA|nr:hypothetical protein SKAU_G00077530 [Synaphobranchus kaupii]
MKGPACSSRESFFSSEGVGPVVYNPEIQSHVCVTARLRGDGPACSSRESFFSSEGVGPVVYNPEIQSHVCVTARLRGGRGEQPRPGRPLPQHGSWHFTGAGEP